MVRHFPILKNSESELSVDPRNGRLLAQEIQGFILGKSGESVGSLWTSQEIQSWFILDKSGY